MKKILLVILMTASKMALAENTDITPFPDLKLKDGINIVKTADIIAPGDRTDSNEKSSKLKGYVETNEFDESIKSLFIIKKDAQSEIKSYDQTNNPVDSHLKSSYKKIPLSFKYSGLPIIASDVIGYAAAGGYSSTKGWDGVVGFFATKNLGTCSYTTYAIKKVLLGEERIEYIVNNKPSIKSIKGNHKLGFLYSLDWYDNDRLHSIECANKVFNSDILKRLIILAKNIDERE